MSRPANAAGRLAAYDRDARARDPAAGHDAAAERWLRAADPPAAGAASAGGR